MATYGVPCNGMGNETFEAVLVSIDQMVDNANRSIKVYARVAHPQKDFRPRHVCVGT